MPSAESIGLVTPQTAKINTPLQLESGSILKSYELVYETYGELNADKSNAILICHALSGHHHAAGYHSADDKSVGWWNNLIGPGKAIDTNLFYVVCSNNLGGCHGSTGPVSINPLTKKRYGPDFPIVTVADWVNSQVELSDLLQIDQWAAIVGGSLGGMQVIQWSTHFSERIRNAIIIASSPKLTAQNIAFNEVARQAIRTDPEFHDGYYFENQTKPTRGLRIARMLGHITYLSDDMMAKKFGRALRNKEAITFEFDPEFQVESYLQYQADRFADYFDANTYLLMTKALDYFDPAEQFNGDLSKALSTATANFLIISFSSDWRFSPQRSRDIVKAVQDNNLNLTYAEIKAAEGHDSFLFPLDDYVAVFSSYMQNIANES